MEPLRAARWRRPRRAIVETALATGEESVEALRGLDKSFPALGAGVALAAALLATGDAARAVDELVTSAGGDELPLMPACWRPGGFELLTRCQLTHGRLDEASRRRRRALGPSPRHRASACLR